MFKKYLIVAILALSASAHASGKDCYMAGNCPGNPNVGIANESAFSSANMNNITEVFTQLASVGPNPSTEAGMNPTSTIEINDKTNKNQQLEDIDDNVEQ